MNAQQKDKKKGFTIIEVVLVLAIAGLIFLMVFIALPALQRNQRDTQRKKDLSRAQTAINNYQSNNRNSLPSDWSGFASQYLRAGNDPFADPSGENYVFDDLAVGSSVPANFSDAQNKIYYTTSATCGNDGAAVSAGARKVALRMKLEGGGVACVN